MWFTEVAWPPMVIAIGLAVAALVLWRERLQRKYLLLAVVGSAAAIATYFIEKSVVTDRERIEDAIDQLAMSFQRGDSAAVLDAISQQAPALRQLASLALKRVEVTDISVTAVNVELRGLGDSRAKSHFRVNGTVTLDKSHKIGHQPTRWIATWQKETDRWRMIDIEQLDPISGEGISDATRYLRP